MFCGLYSLWDNSTAQSDGSIGDAAPLWRRQWQGRSWRIFFSRTKFNSFLKLIRGVQNRYTHLNVFLQKVLWRPSRKVTGYKLWPHVNNNALPTTYGTLRWRENLPKYERIYKSVLLISRHFLHSWPRYYAWPIDPRALEKMLCSIFDMAHTPAKISRK